MSMNWAETDGISRLPALLVAVAAPSGVIAFQQITSQQSPR